MPVWRPARHEGMEKGEWSRSPTHNQLALQCLTQLSVAGAICWVGCAGFWRKARAPERGEDIKGLQGGDRALPGEARLRTGRSCCGGVGPRYQVRVLGGSPRVPGGE